VAEFDPYLQWLGIRDPQRPPNHYRLLGLELFEANEAVIANAADRQMAHVRTFQAGQHGELSQKVLNELAAARVCLLKPDKKAAYDQQLRAKTAAARPAPAIPRPIPAAAASKPANVAGAAVTRPAAARPAQQAAESPFDEIASAAASTHYSARRKRKQQKSLAPYALAAVVILAIAVFGLVAFKAGPKPDVASNPPNSAAVEPRQADFPQKAPSDIPDKAKPEDKPAIDPKIKPKATPTKQDGSESQTHSPVIEDTRPAENEVATNDTAPNQSPTDLPSEVKEDSPNSKSEADSEPADVAEEAVATETPAANKWPHIGPQPLDSKLVAIPSANDRKAAVERIREIFGKDLDEARTADAKHKLANTLIEQATATKSDPAAQFVLLDLAKDLAVSASDVDLAQHAIELQSDQFAVDPLALKYDALIEINRHARNADARAALVPVATQLVDAAIERNDFALALKFNKFVQQAATKARDRETMKSTLARDKSIKEMQRQQETAIAALEKIKADPKDALANFELGAYLCFVKQDWAEGLLRLSKSNHPLLQDAALQELTKPTAAAKQKQLADLWLKCTQ
jgi:propanediol dehydratase small subunit